MANSPLYGKAFDRQSQYRDRLAAQLLSQGADSSPVQHWTQGAARLAQALAGGLIGQKQDERYAEREKQSAEAMANLFAPSQQFTPSAAGAGPRPGAQMQTAQPTLAEMAQRAAAHPATAHLAPQFQMQDMQNQQALAQRGTWKAAEQNGLKGQVNSATGEFKPDPLPRNTTGPQGLVAEYEYAKGQGFKGSILDYQTAKGAAGRAPEAPAGQGGAFAGSGMPAQIANILLDQSIPPTDPRYHYAYSQATTPRREFDPASGQLVTITPQLPPTIRQPVYPNQGGAPQAQSPAAPNAGGLPVPAPSPAAAPAPQQTGEVPQQVAPGVAVQNVAPPRVSPADKKMLDQATTDAAVLTNALNDYVGAFQKAGPGENIKSVLGVNTPVNTAFSNAALMAKGESLFNLGVLNGPDLDIIRRTLPDPSTLKGQSAGPEAAKAAAQQISRLIQDRVTSYYRQRGQEPPNMNEYALSLRGQSSPPTPGGSATPELPPGFKVIE